MGRKLANDQQVIRGAASQDFDMQMLMRLVGQLEETVAGLARPTRNSVWSDYESDCHYDPATAEAKARFVEETLRNWKPECLWDLGCNRGQYSAIAAQHSNYVVAMDGDELAVGGLATRSDINHDRVLPLVMDLGNPSPNQGWGGSERLGLSARGPADTILALALVHHLSISGNVPLSSIVSWLADNANRVIVEFVPLDDPMAQRLVGSRLDPPDGYDEITFEQALHDEFDVVRKEQLPNSGRTLYAAVRR